MITTSILRGYHPENGAVRSSLQVMAFCQQIFGDHFEADFHVLDVCTGGNIRIASRARWQHQAPWFDFPPELLVVHRGQPFFNIVSRFEHFHTGIVSKTSRALQILINGGWHDD